MLGRERERRAIAGGEQIILALVAAVPHRPDRVDHMLGLELIAARDLGRAGVAATERAALDQQIRPGRAMDCAVDATAAQERAVRRVHDGINRERRDVRNSDLDQGRPDAGGYKRLGHGHPAAGGPTSV